MADVFVVTWSEAALELRRIPSEGTWSDSSELVGSLPITRPTRISRLDDPASGGQLGAVLHDLLAEVDLSLPCWLLMPRGWAFEFDVQAPQLPTDEEQLEQLRWETTARLAEHFEEFRFIFTPSGRNGAYRVVAARSELIDRYMAAAHVAGIEIAGIGYEPSAGEVYSFEIPLDLRDAIPVVDEESESLAPTLAKRQITVKPAWAAVILVAALGAGAFYLYWPPVKPQVATLTPATSDPSVTASTPMPLSPSQSSPTKTSSKPDQEIAAQPPTKEAPTASIIATPDVAGSKAKVIEKTAASITATPTPSQSKPVATTPQQKPLTAGSESPLRQFVSLLPSGAKVSLAVISASGTLIEVLDLADEPAYLAALKTRPELTSVAVAGRYSTGIGRAVVVRSAAALSQSSVGRDPSAFERVAREAGLTARGRTAGGSMEAALRCVDALYRTPGIAKVTLARSGSEWSVTVQ
ncbi:MAG: hypothetical protein FJY67_11200 [Calditrichaeota bacterium]|nr:hypothetical protein [Calditrichota bacterium]